MAVSPAQNPCVRRSRALLSLAVAFVAPALFAQASDPQPAPSDPAALVRRSIDQQLAADAAHTPQRFRLHRTDDRRDVIREIVESKDGDVARLVAVNGKPLGSDADQAEINRLNYLKDHPELQEHRRRREQEDTERINGLIRLLPDAFLYQSAGTIPCASGECQRLTFTPNPHFDPPDMEANILRGLAGEMWVDANHQRIAKIDAHLIDDVDFGWGMIGRLKKGGTVLLEQSDTGNGQWAVTRMKLNLSGKALLVKSISVQLTEEESDFTPLPSPIDFREAIRLLQLKSGQLNTGQLKSGQQ